MADKEKKGRSSSGKSGGKSGKSGNKETQSHKRQIIAILMMVAGLLIGLAIVFYSRGDEAALDSPDLTLLNVLRFPFVDSLKHLAEQIQNPFGLLGALVSGFFVLKTIGYASVLFPILLILWGWILLRLKDIQKPVTFTNYAIIFGLLFSTTFGIANIAFSTPGDEWSGIMGRFLAEMASRLLGVVGSSILVITLLFITLILAIDLDLHKTLDRVSALWAELAGWFDAKTQERAEKAKEDKAKEDRIKIKKHEEDEAEEFDDEEETDEEPPDEAPAKEKGLFKFSIGKVEAEEPPPAPQTVPKTASKLDLKPKPMPALKPTTPPVEAAAVDDGASVPADFTEEVLVDYVFPSVELLDSPRQTDNVDENELKANAELVKAKLANFGIEIESVSVMPGPVITLYELVPASGVKISRIVALADDLALALAAKGIRIIAPIPGKSAVGVEIPNKNPLIVHLRSVLNSNKFRESTGALSIALGKTISGEVYVDDLAKMPHLLIAGSTGSGKSVGINTIIASLLYRLHPSDVKFVLIDPKKIELTPYKKLLHHFLAVSPDVDENIITSPENAVAALKSVEVEMERRYDRLAAAGVRNIADYNDRFKAGRLKNTDVIVHRKMPYLVLIIDELADLMITAAKEVEEPIARLAQLARAVGIHLILATQRPSVDVITGVIKANFPARIAFQVASKTDSRTILDMNGAEQLLGMGDMLYMPSGSPKPIRIQNAYISTEEVEAVTDHIDRQPGFTKPFALPSLLAKKAAGSRGGTSNERDEFFIEAARLIVRHQQGSVSLLQRRLKVGYSRAARIVDELEAAGIVGPFDGSKARLVLIDSDEQLDRILETLE
jgi:S-DNA-T family DNA segregation ATPase FtsK/SpoIIIE